MTLHDQIMNLPCETVMRGAERNIYRLGHLDARLAAAELAVRTSAELERLRKIVADLPMCEQCGGRFPYAKLSPASPHPEAASICESCIEQLAALADANAE